MRISRRLSVLPLIAVAAGIFQSASAQNEVVDLKDKSGLALTARLVSSDGTSVTITRQSDNKTFAIPLERLDAASQAAVQAWVDKGGSLISKYEFLVETGKNRRTTGQEDFDDKRVNLEPVITIRNPDPRMTTRDGKVTVFFLGRPVADTSAIFVIKKSSFALEKLAPLTTQDFPIGKITCAYDDRGFAKFGARYLGYVIIIHDAEGKKILDSVSLPPTILENRALKFLSLDQNQNYDRNLKKVTLVQGS